MRHPALFLACWFILGLAVGGIDPRCFGLAGIATAAGVGALGLCLVTARSAPWWWGALALTAVAGGAVVGAHDGATRGTPPMRHLLAQDLSAPVDAAPALVTGTLLADAQPGHGGGATLLVEPVEIGGRALPPVRGPRAIRVTVGGTPLVAELSKWREGTTIRVPLFLRVPAVYRNPGVEDAALGLARRGVALVGSAKSAALIDIVSPATGIDAWAADLRARVRRNVRGHLAASSRAAAVCLAILIGDRTGLDDATVDRLRRAGTFHVIAISGGNVALFTAACVVGLRLLRVRPRPAAVAAIATLLGFGLVVERSASVDRALTVAVLYLVAQAFDHRASPLNVVGTTALGSGWLDPAIVFDVGAQLTFGATVGLLVGASAIATWLRTRTGLAHPGRGLVMRAGAVALDAVAATMAAEAAVVPISAVAFGQVTVAGLVLNLVAIPAMAIVQLAGIGMLATSPVSDVVASWMARATIIASDVLIDSALLVDYLPWLVLDTSAARAIVRAPSPAVVRRGEAARGGAGLLVVTFLDVGQGDATLVQFPSGASLLIDAGGAAGTTFDIGDRVIVPAARALGVARLTWLALTHGDPDHVSGAERVLEQLRPAEVWEGIPVPRSQPLADILEVARRAGTPIRNVNVDETVRVDGVEVRVLHPPRPDWERQRVRNDDSIVLSVRYGDVQFILPGDIGTATEEQVLERVSRRGRLVLKAAHHGSRTSSSAAWVTGLHPDVVVFSAGRANRFGHPAPDVVARYARVGTEMFRTDRDGAIRVATDGSQLWAVTMDGRRWWKGGRP